MKKALSNWPFYVVAGFIGIYLFYVALALVAQIWAKYSGVIIAALVIAGTFIALRAFLRFRRNNNSDGDGDDGEGGQHVHIHVHYD